MEKIYSERVNRDCQYKHILVHEMKKVLEEHDDMKMITIKACYEKTLLTRVYIISYLEWVSLI